MVSSFCTDGTATPTCGDAVTMWYDEVSQFDFNNMDAQLSSNFMNIGYVCCTCVIVMPVEIDTTLALASKHTHTLASKHRHFSQLVWKSSTQVGCGVALCPAASVVVCWYNPAGNMGGSAWSANIGRLA